MADLANLYGQTTYQNADGLTQKFGAAEVTPHARAGEYTVDGVNRVIEFVIDLSKLNAATSYIISDALILPAGAIIDQVEVKNVVATAINGAPTIHVGVVGMDRENFIDEDGILVSAPVADWDLVNERKVYEVGSTGDGALVSAATALSAPGYATVANSNFNDGVTDFTAGTIRVRLYVRFATTT
jgi:hypothetical protein